MTHTENRPVVVLSRALDQAGDALAAVRRDQFDQPTPCAEWTVGQLVGHLVASPGNFLEMMGGGEPDWSRPPQPPTGDWAAQFRSSADDLIHAWHQAGDADAGSADWQTAEFAVHTWDLTRATGQSIRLDPEVAERGYAFMSQALTSDNRGAAFGPELSAAEDADPYERLAAFAGREPSWAAVG